MLLGTGQMVSEPGCSARPPLCEGLARGAGDGSCFDFTLIWQPARCTGPASRRVSLCWGTKPGFHLVIAPPDVTTPVQSCPCATVGKPVPRTWDTRVLGCRATFPPTPGPSCAMPTALPSPPALSQPFPAGTSSVARARGSEAGHGDSPQDRRVHQGKVRPVLHSIPVEHWPNLTASRFSPGTS